MNKEMVEVKSRKVVGIRMRTSFEEECDPGRAKIVGFIGKYFGEGVGGRVKHRVNPGVMYVVYSGYDSDYRGGYDYFLGEEVSEFEGQEEGFVKMEIPEGRYMKLVSEVGKMEEVVLKVWQGIWGMEGRGEIRRAYEVDFEIYGTEAWDPAGGSMSIYLGMKSR